MITVLHRSPPFLVPAPNAILTGRSIGEEILDRLMEYLRTVEFDSVIPLDFNEVEFIDISCADEFLSRLLMRIGSGELGTRYVFIQGANPSVRETMEAVLKLRGLTALLKQEEGVIIMGELKRPMKEALEVLINRKQATSSDLAGVLDKNLNIVCNRLNVLQRLGLVCRVREGSVSGGGRQYYYESIL